jgi:polyvinyl alcohol dehydrogenase (cytochrome)
MPTEHLMPTVQPSPLVTQAPAPEADWPQSAHDPAHSGYNPAETILSPANVAGLRLAWTGTIGDNDYSPPAIAGGVVYVDSEDGTFAFSADCASDGGTCSPIWTGTVGLIESTPAVAHGVVYVGSSIGRLVAYKVGCGTGASTCSPLWKGEANGEVPSPAVANAQVFVTSNVELTGLPNGKLVEYSRLEAFPV